MVHYQNPKMIVGCIVEHQERVLLCKRAIEPRYGYWTIPAGFLELGESAMAGAARESFEEANARVRIIAPYAHFDVPHIGQAYIIYRAELIEDAFGPGSESLEVKLASHEEIPWRELAFSAVRHALQLHAEDVRAGRFRAHQGVVAFEDGHFVLREHLALSVG